MDKLDVWRIANEINEEYKELNLSGTVIDFEKYQLYSIVTNSTALEGSTLTEVDTQLLLDEGLTAKGKPLEHHLMVKDNYDAMMFAIAEADKKTPLSPQFLKKLNSKNMYTTGEVVNSALGTVDGRTGEFRLVQASSQALGYYMDSKKIPAAIDSFCKEYNSQMEATDPIKLLKSSFGAHGNLVLVHPWQDGNKRTSRLLMNFIQRRSGLPLTKVHKEDGLEYILALKDLKEKGDLKPFLNFMVGQHIKTIKTEIANYKNRNKKGFSLVF